MSSDGLVTWHRTDWLVLADKTVSFIGQIGYILAFRRTDWLVRTDKSVSFGGQIGDLASDRLVTHAMYLWDR